MPVALAIFALGLQSTCEPGRRDGEWLVSGPITPEKALVLAKSGSTIDDFRILLGIDSRSNYATAKELAAFWTFAESKESRLISCTGPDELKVSHSVLTIEAHFSGREKLSCTARRTLFMTNFRTIDLGSVSLEKLPFGEEQYSCM